MSYYYDDAVASGIGFGIGFGYIVFMLVVYVLAVIGLSTKSGVSIIARR